MFRSITEYRGGTERRAFSLREVTQAYGLSLSLIRKEVECGRLPVRRVGKRILVLAEDLASWLGQTDSTEKTHVDVV